MAASDDAVADFPKVIAQFEYTGRSDEELSFKEGDVITVTEIHSDDWFEGILNGKTGLIAAAYVKHVSEGSSGSNPPSGSASPATSRADLLASPAAPAPAQTSPLTLKKSSIPDGRPDLAKALRLQQQANKYSGGGVLKPKTSGPEELKRHMQMMKNKSMKVKEAQKDTETELQKALRKATKRNDAEVEKIQEEEQLTELERKWRAKRASDGNLIEH